MGAGMRYGKVQFLLCDKHSGKNEVNGVHGESCVSSYCAREDK